MKTIEFWEVSSCYDRDVTHIGNFTNETTADTVAGGKNKVYCSVYKKTFTLFDSVDDFENNTKEKIRARALAKLTVEERAVLGI